MNWDWLPQYAPLLVHGICLTLLLLVAFCVFGMLLAIPLGLVQVTGPWPLKYLARGFCTSIRGTPLLIQIWLLYYGLGSLFPMIPGISGVKNFMWLILRDAFYYALLAFTLSFAAYEGEIMRGGFMSVPQGELEAARAFGMSPFNVLHRIWFPRAFRLVLPTLGGEVIGQLKATPLVFTITIMEVFGVSRKNQAGYLSHLRTLAVRGRYLFVPTFLITRVFNYFEGLVPPRR